MVAGAVIVIFLFNLLLGAIVYADYRNIVRPPLQEYRIFKAEDLMEVKEHAIAIVYGVLPAYDTTGNVRSRNSLPRREPY